MRVLPRSVSEDTLSRHEGIVYFLGLTNGMVSVALSVYQPIARTTSGSFYVEDKSMGAVIEAANAHRLQVVGQLHTHPGEAFHSKGDEAGALIRFDGFFSIVIPDYGVRLPSFSGAAIYMFSGVEQRFIELTASDLSALPELLP